MNANKMTQAEMSDAISAYVYARRTGQTLPALMDLLQLQTEAYQNKFWRAVEKELNK